MAASPGSSAAPAPLPSRRFGWVVFWLMVAGAALGHFGLPQWKTYVQTLGAWEVKDGPIVATAANGELMVATVVVQERVNWS